MAKVYPLVAPLAELRSTLGSLRLHSLCVGKDGRNRQPLSAYRAKTGRNQLSNSKFIFGPNKWISGLIKPGPRRAVAYLDWDQQEWAIASVLSGDTAMQEAYVSGDPYLTLAKQAGEVPSDGTKATHPEKREMFKRCALGVQYGMGFELLARTANMPVSRAKRLLELHTDVHWQFWRWSDHLVKVAKLIEHLETVFGWRQYITHETRAGAIRNFPMQAHGAEMLRLACIYGMEHGIQLCAPVHDAILIEASIEEIDGKVAEMQGCMALAAKGVLGDFKVTSGQEIIRYPDRYMDKRGKVMWETVQGILARI
jgi:DNA polymerase I